jgi:hypothetical protein
MVFRAVKTLAVLGVAVVLITSAGCASASRDHGNPWTTHYVGDPDSVWQALHIATIELDYDVETENRSDGTIRAVRTGDEPGATVVLSIDQMMVTNNVKVYVRVAAGAGEPAMSRDQQEKHAKDFLALVNGLLYK